MRVSERIYCWIVDQREIYTNAENTYYVSKLDKIIRFFKKRINQELTSNDCAKIIDHIEDLRKEEKRIDRYSENVLIYSLIHQFVVDRFWELVKEEKASRFEH